MKRSIAFLSLLKPASTAGFIVSNHGKNVLPKFCQATQNLRKLFTIKGFRFVSVIPIGFEPMAASLENLCSIQLSYGTL